MREPNVGQNSPFGEERVKEKTWALFLIKEQDELSGLTPCCSVRSQKFWMDIILTKKRSPGRRDIAQKTVNEVECAAAVDHFVPFRESEDCRNTNLGQEELDATKGAPPSRFLPRLFLSAQLFVCVSPPFLVLHPSAALESFPLS